MKILLHFYLLIIITLLSNQIKCQILKNLLNIQPRQTTLCQERDIPGLICESCDRLAFCVQVNGIWQTYPVEPCDAANGKFCNIYEGKCSEVPGPCNRIGYAGNFPCTSDGIFPDPYDCQIYHMCYQAEPEIHVYLPIAGTAKCKGKTAYSVVTTDCSLNLFDDVCTKPQFTCTYPGETSSWPNNPNIFYICQPETSIENRSFLYPTLYRCAPDEIYNNITCISKMNESTERTKWPTMIKTDTTINNIQTTKELQMICTEELGLIPDTEDCHSYFYCVAVNAPAIHRTCPKNTYFNKNLLSCSPGSC